MTGSFESAAALLSMWGAAIAAAQPASCLPGHWPVAPAGRLAVIACGKAALPMAQAAAQHYGDDCEGIVILPDPLDLPLNDLAGFQIFPASHPVPDERSVTAARAALDLARALTRNDLLLVLLSGGGSSLMCLPARGVSLEEKQALSRQLLSCGATIQDINCVRQHLSRIKGGRLALASRAPVVTLAISDVPGDNPALIASGPTVLSQTTPADAIAVLSRFAIELSPGVHEALHALPSESLARSSDTARDHFHIVASGMTALRAAARWCRDHLIEPVLLGDDLQDEARDLARQHAVMALRLTHTGKPCCILSGGETSVTLAGRPGFGGRNTEYALALAAGLNGDRRIWALAADTDGIDGSGGHGGAMVDPDTLIRAERAGLDPLAFLTRHDSATFFARVGGLLSEGPTGTNVNDFRAILVNP